MRVHTQSGSPQAALLTPEFAADFAVLGPPEHCVSRLETLVDLGLDHLVVVGPSLGSDPAEARAAQARFVADVLPALH
jgi:5,10-methylenetetrahydromethanopterin reductase